LPSDCGGHLIAAVFGGAGEAINLVPMDKTLNGTGGKWYALEQEWLDALESGSNVKVDIQPVYSGSSTRPDSFVVKYEVDGTKFEPPLIKNTPTGD
jgi:filamentous hemagglutinin